MKIILYGAGRIARRHLDALNSLSQERFEVLAIVDKDKSKAEILASEFGIVAAQNIQDAIEKSSCRPDLISILTESGNHPAHIEELCEFAPYLVVEKPLGLSLSQVERALNIAESRNCKIFEVKQNRFNPPVRSLISAAASGALGTIVSISAEVVWCRDQAYYDEASWRGSNDLDGGVLGNQALHHLDLMVHLGGPVKSIFARGKSFMVDIESYDTMSLSIEYENGAFGTLLATNAARPRNMGASITAVGSNGLVKIGGLAVNQLEHWTLVEKPRWESSHLARDVYGSGHSTFYELVWEDCFGTSQPELSLESSLETIRAFEMAIESAAKNARVI